MAADASRVGASADAAAGRPGVVWHVRPFDALTPALLHGALALRAAVFVVEQHCVYQDPDPLDRAAVFLIGETQGTVVATARILPAGTRFAEPSIGRVCTAASVRGGGLGEALMREAIRVCRVRHPAAPIRISAQAYLRAFYGRLGFATVSDEYLEDEIPHVEMLLPACDSRPPAIGRAQGTDTSGRAG
ncbi:MAG: GNAT family N-acetyltransferase [Lautropia sp.]